jgi:hypothetical protein
MSQEQISTMSLAEAQIKLKEVANARKQHKSNPEVNNRLRSEFQMIMAHIRQLQKSGGS